MTQAQIKLLFSSIKEICPFSDDIEITFEVNPDDVSDELLGALEAAGVNFDAVVSIEVSDEEIEQRMTGRRTCLACGATYHLVANPPKVEGVCDLCGEALAQRKDDKPETVKARLATYHETTEPLKDFYAQRNLLKVVDVQGSIEEINAAIMKVLGR
jgi:adenylate kinase